MTDSEIKLALRRKVYLNVGRESELTSRGTPRKNVLGGMNKIERQRKNAKAMRDRFIAFGLNSKGRPRKSTNGRPTKTDL